MPEYFTVIDDGRVSDAPATVMGETIRLDPEALEATLGWTLKPEGLCRDQQCVPIHGETGLVTADGIDLARLATLLDRPLALDREERTVALGVSASARSTQLHSRVAPDFTLPDLHGAQHALSEFRGRKVFLLAWASW